MSEFEQISIPVDFSKNQVPSSADNTSLDQSLLFEDFSLDTTPPIVGKDIPFTNQYPIQQISIPVESYISEMEKDSSAPAAWKSFVSGGVGGIGLVLVGHPFDLIKVRLQIGSQKYSSTLNALRSIVQTDGLRGLYRGMLPPLIGITPIFAVSFWSYALGKKLSHLLPSHSDSNQLSLGQIAFAGGFSAFPTTILMTPFERIKVMLQIQESNSTLPKFNGAIHIISSMIRKEGIFKATNNLYKGTVATILRDAPGSVAYFVVYESLKRNISKLYSEPSGKPVELPVGAILVSGGLAGMANWMVAIPADVIKSRLQAGTEKSGLQILKNLWVNEGPKALFKGLGPALIRAFPANAACFAGVELSLSLMNKMFP